MRPRLHAILARMTTHTPTCRNGIAVLIALTAALLLRAWLESTLRAAGLPVQQASNVAYLLVPPVLLLLLFPVLHRDRHYLAAQFSRRRLATNVVLRSAAIGVLLRACWWCQAIAGVSFGRYRSATPSAIVGPEITFQCLPPAYLLLGFVVMAVMVPLVEEITHRAYVQGSMRRYGAAIAVPASAIVFAVFHAPASWGFALVAGLVLGAQYWRAGNLWPSLITHATLNGIVQLDWHCLSIRWNPPASDIPVLPVGLTAVIAGVACLLGIVLLLRKETGAAGCPGRQGVTGRSRPSR